MADDMLHGSGMGLRGRHSNQPEREVPDKCMCKSVNRFVYVMSLC